MLPPLPTNEQWSLHLPFCNNATKWTGVLMLDKIVQKLLVLIGPFAAALVKALTSITNDVQRASHPINETHHADAVH